ECGQYNANWKYIHMMPEETALAAAELRAARLLPVHWGKFALAMHTWDDSIRRLKIAAEKYPLTLMTPLIGQKVNLDKPPVFYPWWEKQQFHTNDNGSGESSAGEV
ncbi:MAG TPA: hypothetical protein VNZ86_17730, partial [Bacteroidia bacterium]|nr:hypothetical protein [Bacteroidia bacterium]